MVSLIYSLHSAPRFSCALLSRPIFIAAPSHSVLLGLQYLTTSKHWKSSSLSSTLKTSWFYTISHCPVISSMNFLCWKLSNLYHQLRPLWTLHLDVQLSSKIYLLDVRISKTKLMIRTSKPALPTIFLKINKINLPNINQYINTLSFPFLRPKKKKKGHSWFDYSFCLLYFSSVSTLFPFYLQNAGSVWTFFIISITPILIQAITITHSDYHNNLLVQECALLPTRIR